MRKKKNILKHATTQMRENEKVTVGVTDTSRKLKSFGETVSQMNAVTQVELQLFNFADH